MEDTDSNIHEENTTPEQSSRTSYNIMSNPTSCVNYQPSGGVAGPTHGDNIRINERTRSRSPAARDRTDRSGAATCGRRAAQATSVSEEERTAVTNALVQSAKALSAVINTKRGPHLPSRVVALMAHDFYSGNIARALPRLVPPPFPTTAKETAKTPAKAPARASGQTPAKAPAKASTKAPAKSPARAPAKAVTKTHAKVPAKAVAMTRPKVPAKAR